jgi:peptide/nickel transport system permease protein
MTTVESPAGTVRPERRVPRSLVRYLEAFRTAKGGIAATIILVLVLAALAAPLIFPRGYDHQTAGTFAGMSAAHPFGTDELGRDLFVRSVYGLRTDLTLVFLAVPVSALAGSILGLIGSVYPWLGTLMQRVFDVIVGFPGLVLALSIVVILGVGWGALELAIVILGLPSFGRLARSVLLEQQHREYVIAARTLGVGEWRLLFRHIVPNAVDPLIVNAAVFLVHAVFLEAGLSVVGLGIQPPRPSLGSLLNSGIRYVDQAPTYVIGPMLVLLLLALGFSLLSDALNERVIRR